VRRAGLAHAPQLVADVPAGAHSCMRRALELLGLGGGAMRDVPLDEGRLDAVALRASIAADRASGALPALLVGSAGTVNAGVIDPLEALADVAAAEGLWFQVDRAYGAVGVLDPAIAARFRGMERADSLVLDPHKSNLRLRRASTATQRLAESTASERVPASLAFSAATTTTTITAKSTDPRPRPARSVAPRLRSEYPIHAPAANHGERKNAQRSGATFRRWASSTLATKTTHPIRLSRTLQGPRRQPKHQFSPPRRKAPIPYKRRQPYRPMFLFR
jgi:Pyridoxal-dependent decarboxylase conserved domain